MLLSPIETFYRINKYYSSSFLNNLLLNVNYRTEKNTLGRIIYVGSIIIFSIIFFVIKFSIKIHIFSFFLIIISNLLFVFLLKTIIVEYYNNSVMVDQLYEVYLSEKFTEKTIKNNERILKEYYIFRWLINHIEESENQNCSNMSWKSKLQMKLYLLNLKDYLFLAHIKRKFYVVRFLSLPIGILLTITSLINRNFLLNLDYVIILLGLTIVLSLIYFNTFREYFKNRDYLRLGLRLMLKHEKHIPTHDLNKIDKMNYEQLYYLVEDYLIRMNGGP